ncbi:hypothetical protein HMN09_00869100 [Mycena chlorophos]|uniref:Uncharacterized protein n=1 Tax=Mycena chlorophos TaxID=658473 RepID=A0A8H6SP05_MYCCL|nr:hypothetical protein HMN09_00869100 [Mycena chlorophos]
MVPELPAEVMQLIASQISNRQALKSCSLAASVFVEPCQRKIYEHIYLSCDKENPGFDCSTLVALLDQSPHISNYIVDVFLHVADSNAMDDDIFEGFGAALEHLNNVHTLNLISFGTRYWNTLPVEVAGAFLSWLDRLTLRRLKLWNIEKMPGTTLLRVLTASPWVQLDSINLAVESLGINKTRPGRELETLDLIRCGDVGDVLLHPEHPYLVASLRTLYIVLNRDGTAGTDLHRLCVAAAETLEHITLRYEISRRPPSVSLPTWLPKLQHFAVIFGIHYDAPSNVDISAPFIHSLVDVVLRPSRAPVLTTLSFHSIIVTRGADQQDLKYVFEDAACLVLVDELVDQHPTMKPIVWLVSTQFSAVSESGQDAHFAAFERAIRAAFPKASAKGMLKIRQEKPTPGIVALTLSIRTKFGMNDPSNSVREHPPQHRSSLEKQRWPWPNTPHLAALRIPSQLALDERNVHLVLLKAQSEAFEAAGT